MGVALASELHECAGVPLSSSRADQPDDPPMQVTDEEAVTNTFIPAEGICAVLVSPHRVLVTGGVLSDDRVLPFTVIRFLDLQRAASARHAWGKPVLLRPASKRKRRRAAASDAAAFPVCRMEQTVTMVPDAGSQMLYLIGGIKVGGKDEGHPCRTMFAFDARRQIWSSVDVESSQSSKLKQDKDQALGPRFAHAAVYLSSLRSDTRAMARKSAGYILVYGGYASMDDSAPLSTVHKFDVRNRRWQLLVARHDAATSPPQRAYHAMAVTTSGRYLVVHGGGCSDFWDTYMLSSDLFVFDLDAPAWHRPALLSTSASPPAARRRHSMVNGIGRHEGSFILFGGQLGNTVFSNELFVLRIIEPAASNHPISAVWEKFDVRLPEPPLPMATEMDPEQQPEGRPRAPTTAVAGGSMIAVPALNKYLFLGGRGAYGMRCSPLLLDPTEAENFDRVERLPPPPSRDPVPIPQPAAAVIDAGLPSKRPSSPKSSLRSDECVKVPGPRKRTRSATGTGESADPVLGTKSRANGSSQLAQASAPKTSRAGPSDDNSEARPTTNVRPVSAVKLRRKILSTEDDDDESIINLVNGEDTEGAGQKVVGVDGAKDSQDLETPPTKRRRFMAGVRNEGRSKAGKELGGTIPIDDESGASDSSGSDFVAASDLARRGKSRTGNAARSRARGRARGRSRAVSAAEARDAMKRLAAEEAANAENIKRVGKLEIELEKERRDKEMINKDNRKLNEQLKALHAEIESLRLGASTRPRSAAGNGAAAGDGEFNCSQNNAPPVAPSAAVTHGRDSRSVVTNTDELRILSSRIADLQEECQEVETEKDAISKLLKDTEEGKRGLETQLNVLKNEIASLEKERGTMNRQAVELRRAATEANIAAQDAKTQLGRTETSNAELKMGLDTWQQKLKNEHEKRTETELEVSRYQVQLTTIRGQLVGAQKKYSEFSSTERRLKGEVESQQGKIEELQKLVREMKGVKQRLEEKNIELGTELESVRSDLTKRSKECETLTREAERARNALQSEKQTSADLDLEKNQLRRDLERTRKKCEILGESTRRREQILAAARLAAVRLANELGPSSSSPEKVTDYVLPNSRSTEDASARGDVHEQDAADGDHRVGAGQSGRKDVAIAKNGGKDSETGRGTAAAGDNGGDFRRESQDDADEP